MTLQKNYQTDEDLDDPALAKFEPSLGGALSFLTLYITIPG